MAKYHFITLDIVRGIAALLIILFHWTYRFNEHPLITIEGIAVKFPIVVSWGYGAIVTFFMLSGFLVGRYITNDNTTGYSYLTGRLVRLYPTFWCGVIITTLLVYCLWDNISISYREFILNLTMLPALFHAKSIDGAYWTMQTELFFSFLFFLVLCFYNVRIKCISLIILLVTTAIINYLNYAGININGMISIILIPQYFYMFLAGSAVYGIFNNARIYSIITLLLCFINVIFCYVPSTYIIFFLITLSILLLIPIIDHTIDPNNKIVKSIQWIAKISYPLYLTHQMIGFAIIRILVKMGFVSEWLLVIPFISCCIIAWCIHKFIEIPTAEISKKLQKKLSNIS